MSRPIPCTKYAPHVRKAYWQPGRRLPLYEDTTPATVANVRRPVTQREALGLPDPEPPVLSNGKAAQQLRLL